MIPKHESLTVEFKSDPKSGLTDKVVTESVVGLANSDGGTLYIGVHDDGTVGGLQNFNAKWADPLKIQAFVADNTVPALSVVAELITIEDKKVAVVHVPQATGITATKDGKVLKRRLKIDKTPENIPLYPYEFTSRLSDLGLLDFTDKILPGSAYDDLDAGERARLRKIIYNNFGETRLLDLADEELDLALGLARSDENGTIKPTVCGLLLIGKEKRLKQLIPTAGACFQVLQGTDVVLNLDLDLPILSCFETILTNFRARNSEKELNEGLNRIAIPAFSETAFREALINAFSHRDYAKLGRISVRLIDDVLTITSPGSFIDGIYLENLLTVEPKGRNPRLADALKRAGLAEKTGRGIDKIFEGSIRYGRPWPDYSESTPEYVRVSIMSTHADMDFYRMLVDFQNANNRKFGILQLLILSSLQRMRRLSYRELSSNLSFPQDKIRQELENLIEDGLIERIDHGSYNKHEYVLSQVVYQSRNRLQEYANQTKKQDMESLALSLIRTSGNISKTELSSALNLTPQQSYYLLKQMVGKGLLSAQGSNRNRRYILVDPDRKS